MLGAEPRDLLVAFPVIGAPKLRRLAAVAALTRVTVALDSLVAAQQLSEAAESSVARFGVLVEIDVGLARVGVAPGDALASSRALSALPGLDWRDVLPEISRLPDHPAVLLAASEVNEEIWELVLRRSGYDAVERSSGSQEWRRALWFAWLSKSERLLSKQS